MGTNFDEELKGMFEHLNFGGMGGVSGMLETLMRNTQINVLRQLRKQIDDSIKRLASEGPSAPGGLNPFEILDVSMDATREDIDKAYKKKAAEHHPDKGGTNMDMIKINAAYEAIKQLRGWKK